MLMPGRRFTTSTYRYGFNGKENDNDIKGEGNEQDYGMRIYDSRIGKFLSVDPLTKEYPWYTPYQFAGNKPIIAVDFDGLEEKVVITAGLTKRKPILQKTSDITEIEKYEVRMAAINYIINKLQLPQVSNPKEPPLNSIEYGTMGELTIKEQREVIERTVVEFVIRIGEFNSTNPTFNPNMVEESYTATYDFNYSLLGNQERIDDFKKSVKLATTVVNYSNKVNTYIGGMPKFIKKLKEPSAFVENLVDKDYTGAAERVAKFLVKLGLDKIAKRAPSLAPAIGIIKGNTISMTFQMVFANSAPENNNMEIKERRIEALRLKTIAALLLLFENNNKLYIKQQESDSRDRSVSDHPEDNLWKRKLDEIKKQ